MLQSALSQAGSVAGKSAYNGAELDTQAEHVWEVRDGKTTRFENRVDQDAWAQAWS